MSPSILSLEIQKQKDWLAQKKTEMNEITAGDEAFNYTAGYSTSVRQSVMGNGWTVDMIAHILQSAP